MIEVILITKNDLYYNEAIKYAKNCSWKAGASLARKMESDYFKDWQRVIITLVDGHIAGFATVVATDSIENTNYMPFIGYVYIDNDFRGKRLSQRMIDEAVKYLKSLGFKKVYIHSGEVGLYERFGFKEITKALNKHNELEVIYEKVIE